MPRFAGDACAPVSTSAAYDDTYAYTPFVPPARAERQGAAWLNSLSTYHNRGKLGLLGESS
jgi:hypothetical protein